jgi:PadR family transcriptional regulator AphA
MSLRHAILCFLQFAPMTGYVLKTKEFDHTVVHIWPASLPQIYRELKSMEEEKLIKRVTVKQTGRRDGLECHITSAGRKELQRWLRSEVDPSRLREAFLVQLFFSAQLTDEEILAMLEYQLQIHRDRLADLLTEEKQKSKRPLDLREQTLQGLTRVFAVRSEQLSIDWLAECIDTVKVGLPQRGVDP